MHLNVHAKQRLATVLLRTGTVLAVAECSTFFVTLMYAIAIRFRMGESEWESLRTSFWLTVPLAVVPFLAAAAFIASFSLSRDRVFNDGGVIESDLFHYIADVLHSRGIRDAYGFVEEHPEHVQSFRQLFRDRPDSRGGVDDIKAVAALIFLRDDNPERTREAILDAITVRGLKEATQIRELLESSSRVVSPLMDGAL